VPGRPTPDDFEQLAAAFRPSWEFDEAPFTGPGSMSPAEIHTLQGAGGVHAEIRAAAPMANGVGHAVPKPTPASVEPKDSIIVDRALSVADVPPPVSAPAPTPAPTPFGPPVSVAAPAIPSPARPASPDRLAQTRIVQRPFPAAIPLAKESTGSFDLGRRSKRPLWIGLGVGAVALAAVGVWAASGTSGAPAPPASLTVATTAPTRPPPDIPPPPETTPAQAAQPAPAPTPKTVPVSALAQVPMPAQTSAPPPARPAVAPSPPPAPAARPVAPAPRPVARPKAGGGTIVHDVPF
jgi:hypothetical protein